MQSPEVRAARADYTWNSWESKRRTKTNFHDCTPNLPTLNLCMHCDLESSTQKIQGVWPELEDCQGFLACKSLFQTSSFDEYSVGSFFLEFSPPNSAKTGPSLGHCVPSSLLFYYFEHRKGWCFVSGWDRNLLVSSHGGLRRKYC